MADFPPNRFVILHHQLDDSEHFDLMLEHGEGLLTWQIPCRPDFLNYFPMPARRLADHRKAYLTYEGPVSKNRGTVRRVDAGPLVIEEYSDCLCRFQACGQRLSGTFLLEQVRSNDWTLRPIE